MHMKITLGIADDQQLFLRSLCALINTFPKFEVIIDAMNGEDLIRRIDAAAVRPEIVLLDVNMPVMDGISTAANISKKYPAIKMAALSMKDDDATVISMIRAGCCAYMLKDMHPDELEKALEEIQTKGYYNADSYNVNYRRLLVHADRMAAIKLSDKEKIFLQLACSDLTYKQIASQMYLSERTIDGYRESIFVKFNVQSRVGMVLEAIKKNLVELA